MSKKVVHGLMKHHVGCSVLLSNAGPNKLCIQNSSFVQTLFKFRSNFLYSSSLGSNTFQTLLEKKLKFKQCSETVAE